MLPPAADPCDTNGPMSDEHPKHDAAHNPGDFVKGVHENPAEREIDASGDELASSLEEHLQTLAEEAAAARDQALRAQAELEN
jgi:molecular chaperone GrpE (heat shock protein)